MPCFIEGKIVASEQCVIFPTDDPTDLLVLHNDIHEMWVRKQSSSLKTWLRYAPSDCYETFPFPNDRASLQPFVEPFLAHRNGLCRRRGIGLTDLYNLYHDPDCADPEVEALRDWHQRINRAVADAYGWKRLKLDYGFHEYRWGRRYTFSDKTRRRILDRLLLLNVRRRRAEEAAGLWDEGASKRTMAQGAKRGRKAKQPPAEAPPTAMDRRAHQRPLNLDDFQLTAPSPRAARGGRR